MKKKRILIYLAILFIGILSDYDIKNYKKNTVSASSSGSYFTDSYQYHLDENDNVIIEYYLGNEEEVQIDEIDGKKVIEIQGRAFQNVSTLKKIVIGEGVEIIGKEAFYWCTALQEVTLPESLTTIQDKAFWECESLEYLYLPKNLNEIGDGAFASQTHLVELELSNENSSFVSENGILYDLDCSRVIHANKEDISDTVVLPETIKRIGSGAFTACEKLTGIQFSEGLESIGEYAFKYCSGLETIEFSTSLKRIEESAFSNCTKLEGLEFPNGIEYIGTHAFSECDSIIEVIVPESVTEIGAYIFCCSDMLQKVVIEADLENINSMVDCCSGLKEVQLPDNLKVLNGFRECGLEEFTIPDSVEIIESHCFWETKLKSIFIPAGVKEIQERAIARNNSLSSIEVAEGNEEFYVQSGMLFRSDKVLIASTIGNTGEIEIPDGCIRIGGEAFSYRSDITAISIPDTVTEIGEYAFGWCFNLSEIELGANITKIEIYAFGQTAYIENREHWETGVCYLGNYALEAEERGIIKIKEGCTLLMDYFATHNDNVQKVFLPNSMEYIGQHTFFNCGKLSEVMAGRQIKQIGQSAFNSCLSLERVYLGGENIEIGNAAFYYCLNLRELVIDAESVEFGENSFGCCSGIEKLIVPTLNKASEHLIQGSEVAEDTIREVVLLNAEDADLYTQGDSYFKNISGENIYLHIPAEDFTGDEYTWAIDNTLYFQNDFQICCFFIDGYFVGCDVVHDGEGVIPPVLPEEKYIFSSYGCVYHHICWDIDGDGVEDSFPEQIQKDIEANAVYEVLEERHSWELKEGVAEGTCGIDEIVSYQCSVCGLEEQITGHWFADDKTIDVEASCTKSGVESYHCQRNGCTNRDSVAVIEPAGHEWDEGVIEENEETGAEGIILYTCQKCGESREEHIEALSTMSPLPEVSVNPTSSAVTSSTPVVVVTETPNPTPTDVITQTPSSSPAPTVEPAQTSLPSSEPTVEPAQTSLPSPTATNQLAQTTLPSPTATVEPAQTSLPSPTATVEPTQTPSPSSGGIDEPTQMPSPSSEAAVELPKTLPPSPTSASGENSVGQTDDKITDIALQVRVKLKKRRKVLIEWTCNYQTEKYEIQRSNKKKTGFSKIKEVDGAIGKWTDTTVISGKKYYYRINGIVGGQSKVSSAIYPIRVPLLAAPKISVIRKSAGNNINYIQITLKKYTGNKVEIQYRKGNEKFQKLTLVSDNIKKAGKKFRIRYLSYGEKLSIRVRTYYVKKKKKGYSKWSKEVNIQT